MRRLLNFLFQIVAAAVFVFLCTAAWVVFDGLSDSLQKVDAGLVIGRWNYTQDKSQLLLDRVVDLYNQGEFPSIIVVEAPGPIDQNGSAAMAAYLESHGIPPGAIIEARRSETTQGIAQQVAGIVKDHQFRSVMVVSNYYRVTLAKLSLNHEGIGVIEKAHVGSLQKEDALKIGHQVVALYEYIGKIYLLPAAEKAKAEAQVGLDKAKVDAEQAKDKVDKSIDSMSK